MKILPLADAKAKLSQLVAEVSSTGEEITITRNGRAVAVLVGHDEFESRKETSEILADSAFRDEIRRGIAELKQRRARKFRGKDLDRLFESRCECASARFGCRMSCSRRFDRYTRT